MGWGWGLGRRCWSTSWLSLSRAKSTMWEEGVAILKDAATIRKKARILPSFQHKQAQNPWPQPSPGSNRCDRRALSTSPPSSSVKCNSDGLTPSPTRNSSAPAARKVPRAALTPRRRDPEPQQLTSLDAKQPAPCARQALLPRARWPCLFAPLSKRLGWKGAHMTPGEEPWALSITRAKHVGLSPSVIWFGCVVLHFLHQTFDKV